ncbi:hypothetical protein JZ751_021280 [Albula glossodonta]|uniref:Uncharacterized protein n=1 Tax=Albula glossodonta TaxID=121402 RepID=A0A8T2MTL0_9TELE|nr:hypothetical protein JZ751_021280 [Albula glossodonta]
MSISRKNWSALSSLTRQWTMEDEEEVERERRRKVRTYSTETGESPTEDMPPVFSSSLSISMDKSPMSPTERRVVSPLSPTSSSGRGRLFSPISPTSPTGSGRVFSPISCTSPTGSGRVVSPISCTSPTGSGRVVSPLSPTGSSRSVSSEESIRSPAPEVTHPVVQNGDTLMERKNEESTVPFQRSASVRITTKTQASKAPNLDEDKDSPFQRNSKQRISSRSIQEKMERLAMAAQKSENVRSPSSQKGMYVLMDEVTRKRGLFERDPAAGDGSTGAFSKDFRNFSAGISERLNRWVTKAHVPGSIFSSSDLRNVDIASKRNIWEHRAEEASPKTSPNSKIDRFVITGGIE